MWKSTKINDAIISIQHKDQGHDLEEDQVMLHPGLCGMPSVASYLPSIMKTIVADPKETGIVFLLVTFVLGLIGSVSSTLANYITWFGVFLLVLFLIWLLILFAARALAFPGHLALVKRQLENEVTKRAATIHSDALDTASSGLLQLKQTDSTQQFLSQLKVTRFHFERNLMVMRKVLSRVKNVQLLSSTGSTYLSTLEDLLTLYEAHFKDLIDALVCDPTTVPGAGGAGGARGARGAGGAR